MIVLSCIAIVFVVTLLACVSDATSLRIPNLYSVIVLAAFAVACVASPEVFNPLWKHFLALAIIFIVTYLMFVAGMMGGGDSKFASALAIWIAAQGVMVFVFWMAVAGGVIGVLTLWMKKKKPFKNPRDGGWVAAAQKGENKIPYGIAISFGAWMALLHGGLITHQLGELFKIIH
ncbi:MAG: prepilin peptidase [Alphaproteobacteria bacterium]|nr:prepilin peptidase [Alphaproteobacteria bacterium]